MNSREAFASGFLLKCAEAGLDPYGEEVYTLLKTAFLDSILPKPITNFFSAASTRFGETVGNLGGLALVTGLVAPPVAGYAAGYAGAKATESEVDPEFLKKQELINEYRRLAAAARRKNELRKVRLASGESAAPSKAW